MPNNNLLEKSKEVQTRYWRRKMNNWGEPYVKRFVRRWFRLRNYRKEAKALENYNEGLKLVAESTRELKLHGVESTGIIYNATLFFLLANRDIQALKLDALSHPNDAVRKLATRVFLLTIFELDLSKVTERDFTDALVDVGCSDVLKGEITQCLRKVRKSHHIAKTQLRPLRLTTIAHRDADALTQYDMIEGINENKVISDCTDFILASNEFLGLLRQAVAASSGMPNVIKQLARRIDSEQKNGNEPSSA